MLGSRGSGTRSGTPADWLIVGLGNPGAEYAGTRHNVGEEAIAVLAARHGARLKLGKERAVAAEVKLPTAVSGPQREGAGLALVVLAFPQTYMNLSGESVRMLVKRHGITDPARVVVVHDELDLAVGVVRCKLGGGTAGHNGLKSIQSHLSTNGFARVRIGIGRPPGTQAGADYVLKRPGKADRTALDVSIEQTADAVELLVSVGFERAQNDVNSR